MPSRFTTTVLMLSVALILSGFSAEEIREVTADTLEDGYQTEFPNAVDEIEVESPEFRPVSSPIASVVFWTLLAVGAGLLVLWLGSALMARRDLRTNQKVSATETLEPALSAAELENAEMFAAQADYSGAVHALLLQAMAKIKDRGDDLPDSLTSREVLSRVPLSGAVRAALSQLVDVVERSHFGGREADAEDWDSCAGAYRELVRGVVT